MTIQELKAELEALIAKIDDAKDETEVLEIEERAKEIKAEIAEKQAQEAKAEKRAKFNPQEARRQARVSTGSELEAREAYRSYMMSRADATTIQTDIVIPTVVTNAVTKENPLLGKILAKTTQTTYPAGVDVPVMAITGTKATWANEAGAFEHKKATQGKVSFKAYKLGGIYAMSKEVQVMTLPEFEQQVAIKVVADTIEAKEDGIFTGTGSGQMKGITKETLTRTDFDLTYAGICEMMGALPTAYEGNAEWYMAKSTFYKVLGMVDADGQPIARVNHGFGDLEYVLMGKPVNLTASLPDYTTAPADAVVALYGDMSKYAVNTIWENRISTHDDFDTDEHLVKSVSIVDGKLLLADAFVAGVKPTGVKH